jgi:hypothetical protein
MICQIFNVKSKTEPLPALGTDLMKGRLIQARVKDRTGGKFDPSLSWSPITAGPYLVPVSRWIE